MIDLFPELWLSTLNWQPSSPEQAKFNDLYDQVLLGNQVQNLTRITEPNDFWEKHLWDSLRGIKRIWTEPNLKVIDIGTGAGFPGLPIAIVQPSWHLTLIDGTLKKIKFVNQTIENLSLKNAIGIQGRAEELNQIYTNQFDLALVRAVGNISDCLNFTIPFLRSGGMAVLYRGQWHEEDLEYLQGISWEREDFFTPISNSVRNCIYIEVTAQLSSLHRRNSS